MSDYSKGRRDILDDIAETKSRLKHNPFAESVYKVKLRKARVSLQDDLDYINWKAATLIGEQGGDIPNFLVTHALKHASPLEALTKHISDIGKDWQCDNHHNLKAYVLACLSELTYMKPTLGEIAAHERYRIRPSLALSEIVTRRPAFDFDQFLRTNFEVNSQQVTRPGFVYTIYVFSQFTVISVRGTATVKDWGIDANALRVRVGDRHYHAGFLREVVESSPELQDKVGDVENLYFTGHSLGGAVAALLPHFWGNTHNKCMTPYVFAAPRFCDFSSIKPLCPNCRNPNCMGGRKVIKRPFGYVFGDDLVPHLPPIFLGYSDYNTPPTTLPAGEKWMSGWETLRKWLWGLMTLQVWKTKFWQPHMIEGYRKALGDIAGISSSETAYVDAIFAQHAKSPIIN